MGVIEASICIHLSQEHELHLSFYGQRALLSLTHSSIWVRCSRPVSCEGASATNEKEVKMSVGAEHIWGLVYHTE